MKRVLFVLSRVAYKTLRKFAVFCLYLILTSAGTASIALSLMYFANDWGEMSWTNIWVPALSLLSICLLPFAVALHFLLLLIPKTRKTCVAKFTGRLSYILCVAFVGTFITYGFLTEIGYRYHGWD